MIAARFLLIVPTLLMVSVCGCNRPQTNAASSASVASSRIVDRTFDDIKFEMAENATFEKSMLTPEIEELFGKRIRIRGFIFPTLRKHGLKQFVLVRDNLECCFGPGAALFDCILVDMQPGLTAEYSIRPVTVEGTFDYEVRDYSGTVVAIYHLDGETVE